MTFEIRSDVHKTVIHTIYMFVTSMSKHERRGKCGNCICDIVGSKEA